MKLKSRILQFLPKELLVSLNNICYDVLIPDNNTKVNLMVAALTKYDIDYQELGPGTNRFAVLIDGYVFKIAMDKDGIRDNWSEFSMSEELQPYVTKVYECNGLIIVTEYVTVISKEEFQESKNEIRELLSHLAQGYLLGDVGSINKNFMNWGYRDDKSLVILDFAYIYRVLGDEMVCGGLDKDGKTCTEMLDYDADFNNLICPRCRKTYTFHQIRRKISKEYEQRELDSIKASPSTYLLTKPVQEVDKEAVPNDENKTNNEERNDTMNKFYDEFENNEEINMDELYADALNFVSSKESVCDEFEPDPEEQDLGDDNEFDVRDVTTQISDVFGDRRDDEDCDRPDNIYEDSLRDFYKTLAGADVEVSVTNATSEEYDDECVVEETEPVSEEPEFLSDDEFARIINPVDKIIVGEEEVSVDVECVDEMAEEEAEEIMVEAEYDEDDDEDEDEDDILEDIIEDDEEDENPYDNITETIPHDPATAYNYIDFEATESEEQLQNPEDMNELMDTQTPIDDKIEELEEEYDEDSEEDLMKAMEGRLYQEALVDVSNCPQEEPETTVIEKSSDEDTFTSDDVLIMTTPDQDVEAMRKSLLEDGDDYDKYYDEIQEERDRRRMNDYKKRNSRE